MVLAVEARHRVARLVVGGQFLFLGGHDPALLLGAGHDFHRSLLDVLHRDGLAVAAGSQQGRLVDQVLQVGAGKTGGALGDHLEGHIGGQGLFAGVDFQDLLAALDIGQAHIHLAVETAGTQQGFVQDVGAVGGRHDDDAVVGLEAVHLDQQLVQSLLALVVAAAQAGAALAAHGVDLIDEDDAGHGLFGLVEQVADTGRADAHVHLDEVRAGDGVEGHPGFAGAGAGQQGLAGARRAYQQHAVGDARAQRVELLGALEELDDLFQLFLFLVLAGHVGKGGGLLVGRLVLDLGAAHVHHVAAACAAPQHREQDEPGAAQHGQIEEDLHPGHRLTQGGVVVLHGVIGVGGVVGVDILLHLVDEQGGIGQLVADGHGAVAVGFHLVVRMAAGTQQPGHQPAARGGGLPGAVGQGQVAFPDVHGDDAGIPVQGEGGHLQMFKVMHHR